MGFQTVVELSTDNICLGVEIGIQARLRCVWEQSRGGSSPLLGTGADQVGFQISV